MEDNYGQNMGYGPMMNLIAAQPTVQQQAMKFNPGSYPTHNPNPHYYGFGAFVNTQNHPESTQVGFSANGLTTEDTRPKQSVGLPMNGLVEPSTQPAQNEVQAPPANVAFNGLVMPTQAPIQQKFALQPIPDGLDRSMLPKPDLISSAVNEVNSHLSKNNQIVQEVIPGRKMNNWFTRLLDQRGQDYISSGKLTIDEVSRNAERILDDMIAGRIDYNKQGQDIINPVIIDTLVNYCSNKLAINRAIQFSLGYAYNDHTNRIALSNDAERLQTLSVIDDSLSRNITQAIAIVNQDIGIYEILYTKLKYVAATKNASSLFSLTNDLNNFKKQMKKRY